MRMLLHLLLVAGGGSPVNAFAGPYQCSSPFHKSLRAQQVPLPPLYYDIKKGGHYSDDLSKPKNESSLGRFAKGDELKKLRHELKTLRDELRWAEAGDDIIRVTNLRQAVERAEDLDPELVYDKALRFVDEAKQIVGIKQEDRDALMKKWTEEAALARVNLIRFNLEGLWVGSYGEQGYELINVTYSGDTMVATKVTGDKNVPRGKITFKADLSPAKGLTSLGPIILSKESASEWGADTLERYPGKGHVGKKLVEGNLILFENNFSFIWFPTKQHVLFGRPSPEATIRMLRDVISEEDAVENMRDHLERCFEMDMTTCIARQQANEGNEPIRRIARQKDLGQLPDNTLLSTEKLSTFNFWDGVHFLKKYLEDAMRDL